MIATLFEPLVDLALPRHCAGCERPGTSWCTACAACLGLRWTALDGVAVVATTDYAGPTRKAVLAYKERGRRELARPLGRVLGAGVRALLESLGLRPAAAVLVCVPSTRAAAARRGGDHVARLASRAAPVCGVRVLRGLLQVRHDVLDSAGLAAADRESNLAGAMHAVRQAGDGIGGLGGPHAGGSGAGGGGSRGCAPARRVIVVDDIVSSGSTMLEAVRALAASGWPVAGCVALAATPAAGSGAGVRWQRHFPPKPLSVPR